MAPTADRVSRPTSPAKTCKASPKAFRCARLSRAGFTLIEILVVLGIVAAALSLAIPRLFGRKNDNNIKTVTRHFLVLGKEVRNRARLKNVPMRLVIDMDPANPKYWVEMADGPQVIDPEASEKKKFEVKDDKEKPEPWKMDTVLTKEKKPLPSGLFFGSLETINSKAPITDGVGYIHFFPEGLMEASALQITDRQKLTWTLIFNPLTGQADIAETARALKDVNK